MANVQNILHFCKSHFKDTPICGIRGRPPATAVQLFCSSRTVTARVVVQYFALWIIFHLRPIMRFDFCASLVFCQEWNHNKIHQYLPTCATNRHVMCLGWLINRSFCGCILEIPIQSVVVVKLKRRRDLQCNTIITVYKKKLVRPRPPSTHHPPLPLRRGAIGRGAPAL